MATDGRLRRLGLRVRIAALAALAVAVALAAGAALLVGLLHSRLDDAATTAATLRATDIAALAEANSLPDSLALPGEESALVQVVDAQGRVIASSVNIDGEPPITARRPDGHRVIVMTLNVRPFHEHNRMRVVALDTTTDDGVVTVYAAESLERVDDTTAAITTLLIGGLPILVVIVAAITWWAVGRTLRPVRAISKAMGEITATDLHRRVPIPRSRDEIGQLATAVNDTLGRLDTSVERQRRFVADASHELRGPLASLRADLEISVTHPDATSWTTVAGDTLADVERLQHLTEDLLLLARIDVKQTRRRQPVDLAALVTDAASRTRRTDITVTTIGLDTPTIISGDRDQLHRMVRNLIHNAEIHTRSSVDIALLTTPHGVRLTVTDNGPGIPPTQRRRVFERFVRLDEARTRDLGGTGLGLSIVHEVVVSHQGSIHISDAEPSGATFVIDFPTGQNLSVPY